MKRRPKPPNKKLKLDAEIADFDTRTDQLAEDAAEDKLQRMLANARMTNAKQMLAAKVAILDDVFEKAKAAVNQLPDDQYLSLMTASAETGG